MSGGLESFRKRLDEIDGQLIELLASAFGCAVRSRSTSASTRSR
jgi:hypothetical protein